MNPLLYFHVYNMECKVYFKAFLGSRLLIYVPQAKWTKQLGFCVCVCKTSKLPLHNKNKLIMTASFKSASYINAPYIIYFLFQDIDIEDDFTVCRKKAKKCKYLYLNMLFLPNYT